MVKIAQTRRAFLLSMAILLCGAGTDAGGFGSWSGSAMAAQDQQTSDQKTSDQKTSDQDAGPKAQPTPEQKMLARFPQPVLVGDLIGVPVLDGNDSTIGYVRQVVQTPDGKVKLIVPYRKWLGWARNGGWLDGGRRPVAVPIEVVALLARQINAVDMARDAFDAAPTWTPGETRSIPPSQTITIALGRR